MSIITVLFLALTLVFMFLNITASQEYDLQKSSPLPKSGLENRQEKTEDQEGQSKQSVCGNDLCEPGLGETKESCAQDCSAGD